jgi:hypothetical protein
MMQGIGKASAQRAVSAARNLGGKKEDPLCINVQYLSSILSTPLYQYPLMNADGYKVRGGEL